MGSIVVLLSLVASHSDIDLETVAKISADASQVASVVLASASPIAGAVTLATCNRYEIYCEVPQLEDLSAARSEVISQIADSTGLDESTISTALISKSETEAIEHLFSVGAGLDSAVIGEREIAGQVRRALNEAQAAGTATGSLVRLFQAASRTAKDVGSRTSLGSRGLSVVSVALDLATDLSRERDWKTKNIVIFGTGAYAGATMALLRDRAAHNVSVFSASGRSEAFVASRGGAALDESTLEAALESADIIIGCSGSDHRLMAADIAALDRGGRPLIAVDLALTHDFDPELGALEGVDLIDLESVRMAAPDEQAQSLREARGIVLGATQAFAAEQRERAADAAIVALRRHTQQVLEAEVEKVRAQHGCTAAAEEVEFAMRRMMRQLLHVPTVRARELASEGRADEYIGALETLYGLEVEVPVAPSMKNHASCPVTGAQGAGTDSVSRSA
ncbi:glutamyl-tRNA reductase [Paeniglutamicibacter gangotriensis]|uniref:Glutamyl-tRNA reductase n=1 Tax=Paeniglutamicibacter gangotriensis TaxID=254787 RepID=A0A5B0EG20_9MICC|nr:glutamyl-tRNA reductase [Paeniglutamicibacter gangotriensis]